jgi:hypothetical protein
LLNLLAWQHLLLVLAPSCLGCRSCCLQGSPAAAAADCRAPHAVLLLLLLLLLALQSLQ